MNSDTKQPEQITANPFDGFTLTDEQRNFIADYVMERGKERAKTQGYDFKSDDFMMGAAAAVAAMVGLGQVPSMWIFSFMGGNDPITGVNFHSLDFTNTELRRAENAARNVKARFESSLYEETEDNEAIQANEAFGNILTGLNKLQRIVRHIKERKERAEAEQAATQG